MTVPELPVGFVANTLMIWVEALQAAFGPDSALPLNVTTEFPLKEVEYPGLWVNFTIQGDIRNVGIGHIEYVEGTAQDTANEVYRWQFGGLIEITLAAMGNLERARMIDEVTRLIAVARVDLNAEGVLRETIERNDLVGLNVVWESFSIGGFAETPGTPWGSDDVIYEASISMEIEGEFLLYPATGDLVRLSAVTVTPALPTDPGQPVPGVGQWV